MDDVISIIVIASAVAIIAIRLLRRYNERVKVKSSKGDSEKGNSFSSSEDEEYEPYRNKTER